MCLSLTCKTFLWLIVPQSNLASSEILGYLHRPPHCVRICFLVLYLPARPAAISDKPHYSQCHHYPALCWKPSWRHSKPLLWKLLSLFDHSMDPFNRSPSLPRDIAGQDSLWTYLTPLQLINQFLSPISLCQSANGSLLVCIGYSIAVTTLSIHLDGLRYFRNFSYL